MTVISTPKNDFSHKFADSHSQTEAQETNTPATLMKASLISCPFIKSLCFEDALTGMEWISQENAPSVWANQPQADPLIASSAQTRSRRTLPSLIILPRIFKWFRSRIKLRTRERVDRHSKKLVYECSLLFFELLFSTESVSWEWDCLLETCLFVKGVKRESINFLLAFRKMKILVKNMMKTFSEVKKWRWVRSIQMFRNDDTLCTMVL